jgi:DNA-binding CsgD family transcriptional regulator
VGDGYVSKRDLSARPPGGSPPDGSSPSAIILRAALPQPIASALLLADTLSPREQTAFELLGLGYDNRSIARELLISERTTKRHVTAILKKLKLESRLQAGLTALILFSCVPEKTSQWSQSPMDDLTTRADTEETRASVPLEEESMMTFDALTALRQGGNPVDMLTLAQQEVLAQLTEAEVATLNSVKARLDAVSDHDVEGHGTKIL